MTCVIVAAALFLQPDGSMRIDWTQEGSMTCRVQVMRRDLITGANLVDSVLTGEGQHSVVDTDHYPELEYYFDLYNPEPLDFISSTPNAPFDNRVYIPNVRKP